MNKDLIETFKYIFIKQGFAIEAVVPSSIIGIDVKTIDLPSVDFITAKLNQIKGQSMIIPEARIKVQKQEEKKVFGINRVFILLSVFLVLMIILLFVLYQQSVSNKKPAKYNSYLTLIYDHNIVK